MKTQETIINEKSLDVPMPLVLENEKPYFSLGMKLSDHFTLGEFVRSATAIKNDIDNMPCEEEVERLRQLCIHVLEPLRSRFGVIRITSGFRCYQLNERVGGARTSQHMWGEAADIHVGSTELGRKMYEYVMKNIDFDQMLLEVKRKNIIHCLHISYRSDRGKNRRMCRMNYSLR